MHRPPAGPIAASKAHRECCNPVDRAALLRRVSSLADARPPGAWPGATLCNNCNSLSSRYPTALCLQITLYAQDHFSNTCLSCAFHLFARAPCAFRFAALSGYPLQVGSGFMCQLSFNLPIGAFVLSACMLSAWLCKRRVVSYVVVCSLIFARVRIVQTSSSCLR